MEVREEQVVIQGRDDECLNKSIGMESGSNYKIFGRQNWDNSLIAGVKERERKISGVFIFQFMCLVRGNSRRNTGKDI